mmetsp:Transcript_55545/g.153767  ORF Transcript_55545/g.153767 Transcript_55545/m.153767 type:complete len:303 (-) Transcript_55545:553-1461(-)
MGGGCAALGCTCPCSTLACPALSPATPLAGGGTQFGEACSLATCSCCSWILLLNDCWPACRISSDLMNSLVFFTSFLTSLASCAGTLRTRPSHAGPVATSDWPSLVFSFIHLSNHSTSFFFFLSSAHLSIHILPIFWRSVHMAKSCVPCTFFFSSCNFLTLSSALPAAAHAATFCFSLCFLSASRFLESVWFRWMASWISCCTLPYFSTVPLARAIAIFAFVICWTLVFNVFTTYGVRAPLVLLKARLIPARKSKTFCSSSFIFAWYPLIMQLQSASGKGNSTSFLLPYSAPLIADRPLFEK